MNKELIKKYKNEFNHWLKEGKILYKHKHSIAWWTDDCWNYSSDYVQAIIINDDFVEFRKALAEGKTIQFNNAGIWKDIKFIVIGQDETPSNYRIKPELPFKVGDWVRDTRPGVKRPIVQLQPNCIALTNYDEDGKHYEKWTPRPGEWCWSKGVIVKAFIFQWTTSHYYESTKYEPFIGELPYDLKG